MRADRKQQCVVEGKRLLCSVAGGRSGSGLVSRDPSTLYQQRDAQPGLGRWEGG